SDFRRQYFLSRPRRFGKTLTCWTLDALFSGKRELFEGLAISKTDWAWESFPVIHLDMSMVRTSDGVGGVKESLAIQTMEVAENHGIAVDQNMAPGNILRKIIIGIAEKHGKPAVVIVDEYDKPFLDFYNQPPMAADVRNIMRDYYIQLKANEPNIRFLFMTGIAKFTKAGVFSTLNNLNDLSMDEDFGTMLGYTGEELLEYFGEHIDAVAKKRNTTAGELAAQMKHYYNGFCFDGVHKVYCPFSVLNFFQNGEFDNFWMESANPKIIADYMNGRKLTVEQFRGMFVSRDFVRHPGDMESTPPEGFMFQAGYLTLRERIDREYLLDYPNTEVLNSMSRLVAQNIVESNGEDFMDFRTSIMDALADGDAELFVETVNRLLASIPYDDYVSAAKQGRRICKRKLTAQEWLYRSTILAFLRGCGILTFGEMHSNQGRSDMVVTCRGATWVIEIKVAAEGEDCRAKAEEAMTQLSGNQYADQYKNAKKLAIAIDDSTRQAVEWVEG
ncbi:MAG: ATP-binding protein, partial [Chitinispirillia bacterium]|nr:ATP-binding protein [Chitinispirillia bacterium]